MFELFALGRQKARRQRLFDHIAGQTGILADHDPMAMIAAAVQRAGSHADFQHRVGQHRIAVGFATYTVSAKKFLVHADKPHQDSSLIPIICRLRQCN